MNAWIHLTVLMLVVGLPHAATGASPSLDVDVRIEGKADYKGTSTKTQSRNLTIEIANYGTKAVRDVEVKWWIFGHNKKNHKLVILKKGDRKSLVPAKQTIQVTTPSLKITGTREHKVTSRTGRGKRSRKSTKTVPASGQEYYGYAVEVYQGDALVAAEYSQPSIKNELHPPKK